MAVIDRWPLTQVWLYLQNTSEARFPLIISLNLFKLTFWMCPEFAFWISYNDSKKLSFEPFKFFFGNFVSLFWKFITVLTNLICRSGEHIFWDRGSVDRISLDRISWSNFLIKRLKSCHLIKSFINDSINCQNPSVLFWQLIKILKSLKLVKYHY